MLLFLSCNFNTVRENKEEDKKDAEKITQKFFSLIKENKKQEIFKLFSSKFFIETNENELNQIIDLTNKEAGSISNYSLYEWETTIMKGTDPKNDYLLVYDVTRNKINTQEIFTLEKEGDKIKIIGYKVNLDLVTTK